MKICCKNCGHCDSAYIDAELVGGKMLQSLIFYINNDCTIQIPKHDMYDWQGLDIKKWINAADGAIHEINELICPSCEATLENPFKTNNEIEINEVLKSFRKTRL